jgi:predicted nucleic acid-binding protein
MSDLVFVDASAWIAITHTRDSHHDEAMTIMRRLLNDDAGLVVTNWTAYEALSFLKSRAGYGAASVLRQTFEDNELVWWEPVTPEIEEKALDMFWRFADKTWGVVDCASLVVMALTGCQRAFGFDRHFVEAASQYGFMVEEK